jgi:integrase
LSARSGVRLGEALALRWTDLNFETGTLRVARALSKGQVRTPKSGAARDVDMSPALARRLRRLQIARKTEALRQGWAEVLPWIFCTRTGQPFHPRMIQRAFARTLTTAKLPEHFTPHALRHSYASILPAGGLSSRPSTAHGSAYAPPLATGVFGAAPASSPFAPWVE